MKKVALLATFFLKSCAFNFTVGVALDVAFSDRVFFVEGMLTSAKGNFHFHERVLKVQFKGYERVALAVDFACDLRDFAFMEK